MARRLVNSVFLIIASPLLAMYTIACWLGLRLSAFCLITELISVIPGPIGVFFRRAFDRIAFSDCSESAVISFGCLFSSPDCCIGAHAYIGPYASMGAVDIADDVLIGSHVSIPNGSRQHGIDRLDIAVREQAGEWLPISVGSDSWIGDRAVVMANVGQHCVVGAGAVVTKPVPDYAIVVGCPAKTVGYRTHSGVKPVNVEIEQR